MKKILTVAMALFVALGAMNAQKMDKLAAKEAKKLEKEGWTVRPGSPDSYQSNR